MSEEVLKWREFVEAVDAGELEPLGPDGRPKFMYCPDPSCFISHPGKIDSILRARTLRAKRERFLLLGRWNTGKNVFLKIVARGNPGETPIEVVDENVGTNEDKEMERFFGPGGIVDKHTNALIHFDLLQHAVTWDAFSMALVALIDRRKLRRTDGVEIDCPDIWLVGGATEELEPLVPKDNRIGNLLYSYLLKHSVIRVPRFTDMLDMLDVVLAELLAARFLENPSLREQVARIEQRPDDRVMRRLREHSWPYDFREMHQIVAEALHCGSWEKAVNAVLSGRKSPSRPSVASWGQVEFKFETPDLIAISMLGAEPEIRRAIDLTFLADTRSARNEFKDHWPLFQELARGKGVVASKEAGGGQGANELEEHVRALRKALRKHFDINENPIIKDGDLYRAIFKISGLTPG